ncbi:MAG: RNA methyltransferase [Actinobacteria bacterium]|nr:RNA methyltransferase [Actinomycetota bacterium]
MSPPGSRVITSTSNPLAARVRKLRARKHRKAEGAFYVEGIRPVRAAIDRAAHIEILIVAETLLTSAEASEVVEAQRAAGAAVADVSGRVFSTLSERDHPSGLGAIVATNARGLEDLEVTPSSLFVGLQSAGNPGNVGAILRTLDAVGGSGLVLIGDGVDAFHPTAVKASMGSVFSVPVARAASDAHSLEWAKRCGLRLVVTSAQAAVQYSSVRYPAPTLLMLGSEGGGLSSTVMKRGELAVRIPMSGSASSLNLAVAAGILLYEIRRGRQPDTLSEAEDRCEFS